MNENKRDSLASREASFVSPKVLMEIDNLQLRAKVVVEGFLSGLHRSPYHGFSVEFSEYRQYTPGEDLRHLDWRVFARSDRYYIKRFEDETNLRCHLLLDLSRSMGFSSVSYTKAEYAKTAVATMAYFLSRQSDAVGLLTFHEKVADYLPARYRPGHLHRLMLCLEKQVEGRDTDLALPLEQVARTVTKRGLMVIVSDLMAPIDRLEANLGYIRSRGHEVILFRILDPSERTFPFKKPALFRDLESSRELYVDPDAVRKQYVQRFKKHTEAIAGACRNLGIDFCELTSDQPLELVLFDFLSARMRRGRRSRHRQAAHRGGAP